MREGPSRVPCPLRSAALASPGARAVVGSWGVISYADLDARVSVAARRLAALGFSEGDRVALYLTKDPAYLVSLLALLRAGIVACPVSTRLPAGGVAPLLEGVGCAALISDDEGLAARSEVPRIRPGELVEGVDGTSPPGGPLTVPLERPATVVFTSGSTGTPKAALHTFANHYFNALGSNENIALAPGDLWLHSLPLYHVGGLSIVFRCLLAGATVAMPDPGATIGRSVAELRASHASLVPTQLRRLLGEAGDLPRLEAVLMGGGPIPPSLVDEAVERGLPVHTSYGLTEMASQVTTTPPGALKEQLRTAGRVLAYRAVRVCGEGEILVRGRTLFAGYASGDDLGAPFDREGWFRTGDLGEIDDGGNLRVTGRRDNLFVSGGENVQPEEIEAALLRLHGVEEAVVVPAPDPEFGSRPVAFVSTRAGTGDLARRLEKVLPRFKVPVAFHDWEGTGGMKPDRVALGERVRRIRGGAGSRD